MSSSNCSAVIIASSSSVHPLLSIHRITLRRLFRLTPEEHLAFLNKLYSSTVDGEVVSTIGRMKELEWRDPSLKKDDVGSETYKRLVEKSSTSSSTTTFSCPSPLVSSFRPSHISKASLLSVHLWRPSRLTSHLTAPRLVSFLKGCAVLGVRSHGPLSNHPHNNTTSTTATTTRGVIDDLHGCAIPELITALTTHHSSTLLHPQDRNDQRNEEGKEKEALLSIVEVNELAKLYGNISYDFPTLPLFQAIINYLIVQLKKRKKKEILNNPKRNNQSNSFSFLPPRPASVRGVISASARLSLVGLREQLDTLFTMLIPVFKPIIRRYPHTTTNTNTNTTLVGSGSPQILFSSTCRYLLNITEFIQSIYRLRLQMHPLLPHLLLPLSHWQTFQHLFLALSGPIPRQVCLGQLALAMAAPQALPTFSTYSFSSSSSVCSSSITHRSHQTQISSHSVDGSHLLLSFHEMVCYNVLRLVARYQGTDKLSYTDDGQDQILGGHLVRQLQILELSIRLERPILVAYIQGTGINTHHHLKKKATEQDQEKEHIRQFLRALPKMDNNITLKGSRHSSSLLGGDQFHSSPPSSFFPTLLPSCRFTDWHSKSQTIRHSDGNPTWSEKTIPNYHEEEESSSSLLPLNPHEKVEIPLCSLACSSSSVVTSSCSSGFKGSPSSVSITPQRCSMSLGRPVLSRQSSAQHHEVSDALVGIGVPHFLEVGGVLIPPYDIDIVLDHCPTTSPAGIIPPPLNAKAVLIEVDGPKHFVNMSKSYFMENKNVNHTNKEYVMTSSIKHRLLSIQGFSVLHIPYDVWPSRKDQRENFLFNLLFR